MCPVRGTSCSTTGATQVQYQAGILVLRHFLGLNFNEQVTEYQNNTPPPQGTTGPVPALAVVRIN